MANKPVWVYFRHSASDPWQLWKTDAYPNGYRNTGANGAITWSVLNPQYTEWRLVFLEDGAYWGSSALTKYTGPYE